MAFTVAAVIGAARHSLADSSGYRWKDPRFLPLINEALYLLRNILQIEEHNEFVVLQNNVGVYDLSAKVFELYRAEYNNNPLPLRSFAEMDDMYGKDWQTKKGTPQALIYNLHKRAVFTLYPIFTAGAGQSLLTQDSVYGAIFDIENTVLPFSISPTYTSDFGAINLTIKDVLRIYYTPILGQITAVSDSIPIQDEYLEAIANYCAGRCLEDNTDRMNLAEAERLKENFYNMIQTMKPADARAHVEDTHLQVPYNATG